MRNEKHSDHIIVRASVLLRVSFGPSTKRIDKILVKVDKWIRHGSLLFEMVRGGKICLGLRAQCYGLADKMSRHIFDFRSPVRKSLPAGRRAMPMNRGFDPLFGQPTPSGFHFSGEPAWARAAATHHWPHRTKIGLDIDRYSGNIETS